MSDHPPPPEPGAGRTGHPAPSRFAPVLVPLPPPGVAASRQTLGLRAMQAVLAQNEAGLRQVLTGIEDVRPGAAAALAAALDDEAGRLIRLADLLRLAGARVRAVSPASDAEPPAQPVSLPLHPGATQ